MFITLLELLEMLSISWALVRHRYSRVRVMMKYKVLPPSINWGKLSKNVSTTVLLLE